MRSGDTERKLEYTASRACLTLYIHSRTMGPSTNEVLSIPPLDVDKVSTSGNKRPHAPGKADSVGKAGRLASPTECLKQIYQMFWWGKRYQRSPIHHPGVLL